MKKYLILLIAMCSVQLYGQHELSLQQLIDSTKHYYRINLDTSISYANKALEQCDTTDYDNYGECLTNKGNVYYYLYNTDSADYFYQKALLKYRAANNTEGVQSTLNNLGILYMIQGLNNEALSYYDESYEMALKLNDNYRILRAISNISNLYVGLEDYAQSLEVLLKGKPYAEKSTDNELVMSYYANLFLRYRDVNDYDNWEKYIAKVQNMVSQNNDSVAFFRLQTNIASGNFYFKIQWVKENGLQPNKKSSYKILMDSIIKLNVEALKYFQSKKMKLKEVHLYQNLGEVHQFIENYSQSNAYFLKALSIADSLKMNQYIKELYRNLAENALLTGDIVKNDAYFKKEIEYEALLVDEKINDKIANFEVKYNTLEKEREIDKQRLTIEKQEANRKRQLYFQNFLITGAILLLGLMFVLYRSYKAKKKSNVTILEKNALLIEANEEIRAQNDEIQTQRDLVVSQKDFIEIQKDRLDDSIHYAQRIQNAVLHANDRLNTVLSNSFIIFRPKDVVSGDFYWTAKIEDEIIVAVADCTGHGVPGAFMSMLGISYLNEIVHRKDMNNTNQILEEMRKSIIQALNQKFDSRSQRDSLELGILSFNLTSGEGQWSGAGIPLWISRKNSEKNNQQLEEIPYDAMPVGIYHKMNPFTSQQVQLHKGDRVYIATDGFADQFGGPNEKKFKTSNLKHLIQKSTQQPILKQKEIIENALNQWMEIENGVVGEQIDDITLIGFEV